MRIQKVKGFSLVEVMVALVIMAIGILALSKFHSVLFRSTADAQNRTTALMIAEAKLEDLRNFAQISAPEDDGVPVAWESDNLVMAFDYISSDAADLCNPDYTNSQGGRIDVNNEEGELILNGTPYRGFDLSWRVTNFWHDSDTGVDSCDPAGVGSPDYKVVDVLVSWQDESGDPSSVTLSQIISSVNPGGTFLLANVSAGNPGPKVIHDPGVAPEVIPTCISGNCDGSDPEGLKKETDNPEPEVSQNNEFAAVSFSELSYFNNTNIVAKREDFITVNCVCELQAGDADVTTYEPAYIVLGENDSGEPVLENVAGDAVNDADRRYGERINTGQDGQQNELCDVCCRDHHDFTEAERKYDPFRPENDEHYPAGLNGDHGHFYTNNQGQLEPANDIGDTYFEACKMVRIDGLWRVGQDWKQESIKIVPESVLITNATNYQNYVADFIEDYIAQIDDGYPLTTPDPETVLLEEKGAAEEPYTMTSGSSEQMISRSIFIDYMPPELVTKLKTEGVDLEIVPFRDINTTKLAIWESGNSNVVSVTNEPVETNNQHSRGFVFANSAGTQIISATMPFSNTGLTNSINTDPNDAQLFNDEMTITVTGSPAPEDIVKLSGQITVDGSTALDYDQITVVGVGTVNCETGVISNQGTKILTYSCDFIAGEVGAVRFGNYNPTLCVGKKNDCVDTFYNNALTPDSVEFQVVGDDTTNEYTLFTTTLTGASPDKDFVIVNQGSRAP